jgi:TIR domain
MAEGSSPAQGRIFISYRRAETAYPSGWLFDRLAARFDEGEVFKDVDSIELGDDFIDVITAAVASCDVLLALIGDRWLTLTDEHGRRRIDDPKDFVRLEIEAALTRNVRVIPVLVDGAKMPSAAELPPTLAALSRRQALELSPSRFDSDLGRLLKVLEKTLAELHPASPREVAGRIRRPSKRAQLLGGIGAGMLALAAVLVAVFTSGSHPGANAVRGQIVFRDHFAIRAHGWDDARPLRDGGHYTDGAYLLSIKGTKDHWSEHAYPRKAAAVFPVAPRDIRVSVVGRRLAGGADVGYGITCRAGTGGLTYYQFAIWRDHVAIEKFIPQGPYYVELATGDLSAVRANRANNLEAVCTTDGGQAHLDFNVNGTAVASAIDKDSPLLSGATGLVVATGEAASEFIDARFDDFAVARA